jgi:hypothetical protein
MPTAMLKIGDDKRTEAKISEESYCRYRLCSSNALPGWDRPREDKFFYFVFCVQTILLRNDPEGNPVNEIEPINILSDSRPGFNPSILLHNRF